MQLGSVARSDIKEGAKEYVHALSDEELRKFGENPKQCRANLGVLCETKNNNGVIEYTLRNHYQNMVHCEKMDLFVFTTEM